MTFVEYSYESVEFNLFFVVYILGKIYLWIYWKKIQH